MTQAILQYGMYLVILVVLAIPLGRYMGKVMNGERVFLSRALVPCERFMYRVMHVRVDEEMNWKKYAAQRAAVQPIGLVSSSFCFSCSRASCPATRRGSPACQLASVLQHGVQLRDQHQLAGVQREKTLSYLTQALGLTVQNFVSAATGIAVLFALIRGFIKVKTEGLGSFWVDMTRIVLYILIPLCLVISVCLASQGVSQNLRPTDQVDLLEPVAVDAEATFWRALWWTPIPVP